jgi:hypothetical protein
LSFLPTVGTAESGALVNANNTAAFRPFGGIPRIFDFTNDFRALERNNRAPSGTDGKTIADPTPQFSLF